MPYPPLKEALIALARSKMTYGDARIVHLQRELVAIRNGKLQKIEQSSSTGLFIRVIAEGAWGYASTSKIDRGGVRACVREAVRLAKESRPLKSTRVRLACLRDGSGRDRSHERPVPPRTVPFVRPLRWQTPFRKDPWKISLGEKRDLLLACDEKMRERPGIVVTEGRLEFVKKEIQLATTEGTHLEETLVRSGANIFAKAADQHKTYKRSYPGAMGSLYHGAGWEFIEGLNLLKEAPRVRDEALAIAKAPSVSPGTWDLVLTGSLLALMLHESIGHAVELDRVYGFEDNLGGRTYLTPEKRGSFQVGSAVINVKANLQKRGAGYARYDEEGVPLRPGWLIKKGIFVGYLTSRETTWRMGLEHSIGSMSAQDGLHPPLIRMMDVSLLPGKGTLSSVIAQTEKGLLMDTEASWSIDDERLDFEMAAECAWEIKHGKIVRILKDPIFRGDSIDFWRSCDRVAGSREALLWGFSDCGKGGPYQYNFVSHGIAPARFREIEVANQ